MNLRVKACRPAQREFLLMTQGRGAQQGVSTGLLNLSETVDVVFHSEHSAGARVSWGYNCMLGCDNTLLFGYRILKNPVTVHHTLQGFILYAYKADAKTYSRVNVWY